MFKFNFTNIEDSKELTNLKEETFINDDHTCSLSDYKEEISQIESGVFSYEDQNLARTKKTFIKSEVAFKKFFLNERAVLDYVDAYQLEIDENDKLSKINKTHDLVAGQYEGGLKVFSALFPFIKINNANIEE